MQTKDLGTSLGLLFSELVDGARDSGNAFILNTGDAGLLKSLDKLSAADASRSVNEGATIAAHAQHVRYGLSLMNRWAERVAIRSPMRDGTKPGRFPPWKMAAWAEIRSGLRDETHRWLEVLRAPREVMDVELAGMIASIAHLAYHLGAIRQINKSVRGPKEGTF